MLEEQVIYGLRDLISNKEIQREGGIDILNSAVKLIKNNIYGLDEIGCPNCHQFDYLNYIGEAKGYKYYKCTNCNTRIKVREFKEIVDYKIFG